MHIKIDFFVATKFNKDQAQAQTVSNRQISHYK